MAALSDPPRAPWPAGSAVAMEMAINLALSEVNLRARRVVAFSDLFPGRATVRVLLPWSWWPWALLRRRRRVLRLCEDAIELSRPVGCKVSLSVGWL